MIPIKTPVVWRVAQLCDVIPVKTPVELIYSPYVWRVAKHYPNGEYLIIRGMQNIVKRRVTADMIKPWHTKKG